MIKFVKIDSNNNMVLRIDDYKTEGSIEVNEEDYTTKKGFGKYLINGSLVDIADDDTAARQAIIDKISFTKNKSILLNKLTVTTTSGKIFYADPISRGDLSDAISILIKNNLNETVWKLASNKNGNRNVKVPLAELEEARELALVAKGSLVGI